MRWFALFLAGIVAVANAATVHLAWDAVPDARVTGYELGWGSISGQYQQFQPAPSTTGALDLPDSVRSYIAVRALGLDADQPIQSEWSNEVSWPLPTQPEEQIGVWARHERIAEMAIEYFGFEVITNDAQSPSGTGFDVNNTYTFTSPGTTNDRYRVDSLQMYTRSSDGTSILRMALYSNSLNLICQGSSALTINTVAGWKSHNSSNITPAGGNAGDPCYITGGTSYKLAHSRSGVLYYYSSSIGYSSEWRYNTVDYTGGFPSSFTMPTLEDYTQTSWAVRVGVEKVISLAYYNTIKTFEHILVR